MASYLALLLLVSALATLAGWSVRGRDPRVAIGACAAGLAAAAVVGLGALPVALIGLPLGPPTGLPASVQAGLVIALGPQRALIEALLSLFGVCGLWLAPSRSLAALLALAGLTALTADMVHMAGFAALLVAAMWWLDRAPGRRSAGWRSAWPVLSAAAWLALAAAARAEPPFAGDALPVLPVVGGILLSLCLARVTRLASPAAAGPWRGGLALLVAFAVAIRVIEAAARMPDAAVSLSYASPVAAALRGRCTLDGAAMLLCGAAMALAALRRGLRAACVAAALGEAGCVQLGLVWIAGGLVALAVGASLPGLATAGRVAAMLGVTVGALVRIGGLCAVQAIRQMAGSDLFVRLGGLGRLMPRQSAALALVLAQVAALPPLAGFAAVWALLQAWLTASALGGLPGRCAVLAVLLLLGTVQAGLAALALRIAALALLGRPRAPRVAGAEDPAGWRGAVIWLPCVMLLAVGLVPGALSGALSGACCTSPAPAAGGAIAGAGGLLAPSGAVYQPLLLTGLILVLALVLHLGWRRLVGPASRQAEFAAWQGGAPPPPAWLPFGDPDRQPGMAFLRPGADPRRLRWRPTIGLRQGLARATDGVAGMLSGPEAAARWPEPLLGLLCVLLLGLVV